MPLSLPISMDLWANSRTKRPVSRIGVNNARLAGKAETFEPVKNSMAPDFTSRKVGHVFAPT